MKRTVKITFFLFLFLVFTAQAQYNETIRSARPGQAFGPFTTGKNIFQVQTGTAFTWADDDEIKINGLSYVLSLRYGITERIELRTAAALSRNVLRKTAGSSGEVKNQGLSGWVVGARINIKNGPKSSLALQSDVGLNVQSEDFKSEDPIPRILLLHSSRLSDKLGLTTNWGVTWPDGGAVGSYVINLSFPFTDKLGSFIETYGTYTGDNFEIKFDTGLAYLVTSDFQLDLTFGLASNSTLLDFGVSWRTKRREN